MGTNDSYGIAKCPNCGSMHSTVSTSGKASCCGRTVSPPKGVSRDQYNKYIHGDGQSNFELSQRIYNANRKQR